MLSRHLDSANRADRFPFLLFKKKILMLKTPLVLTALLVAVFLAPPARLAHAQETESDAAAAASAVREFHVALEKGDVQAATKLLAPDATILEGGVRETRKEYIDHHLAEDIKFAQAVPTRHSKIDVTVSGQVAWAVSTGVTQGTFQSKPVDFVGAELMVLSKSPTGWVIRSIHWSSRKSK